MFFRKKHRLTEADVKKFLDQQRENELALDKFIERNSKAVTPPMIDGLIIMNGRVNAQNFYNQHARILQGNGVTVEILIETFVGLIREAYARLLVQDIKVGQPYEMPMVEDWELWGKEYSKLLAIAQEHPEKAFTDYARWVADGRYVSIMDFISRKFPGQLKIPDEIYRDLRGQLGRAYLTGLAYRVAELKVSNNPTKNVSE